MTAAHKRVQELLDRWLASVDLHVQYLKLDDAAYARAQDWPRHQRPTQFIVQLARTRLLELKANLDKHGGDASFAESLELMSFLTTLLGSEHIERFIPLATGKPADPGISGTVEQPRLRQSDKPAAVARKAVAKRSPPKAIPVASTNATAAPATPAEQRMINTVIADAARFLEWGREWPALASQIARLADRPSEAEVRSILRLYKVEITQRAKRPLD